MSCAGHIGRCRSPSASYRCLRVGGRSVDTRNVTAHRAQVGAELATVVDRMLYSHGQKVNSGRLDHSEQVDYVAELLPRHCTHAIKGGRNFLSVTSGGFGRVHNAAGIGIVGRRRELTIRDAIQQPLIFQREMPDEPQAGLRFRVRLVVETIVGNCADHPKGCVHFAFEISDKKISYSLRLFGIHKMLLFLFSWGSRFLSADYRYPAGPLSRTSGEQASY